MDLQIAFEQKVGMHIMLFLLFFLTFAVSVFIDFMQLCGNFFHVILLVFKVYFDSSYFTALNKLLLVCTIIYLVLC